MRNKVLTIIALLGIAVGSIQAAETKVTYRMKVETNVNGDPTAGKITFVREGDVLGNLTGNKVVNITNVTIFQGFEVTLDDGLKVDLKMNAHQIDGIDTGEYFYLSLNKGGSNPATFEIKSSEYYITNIMNTLYNAEG